MEPHLCLGTQSRFGDSLIRGMMLMLAAGHYKAQFVAQISPQLKAVMNEAIYAPDITRSLKYTE